MSNQYDVVVVGGGPAGVSVSYCLAKLGHKVVILDKKPKTEIGNKTCGDALNFNAPEVLHREYGLALPQGEEVSDVTHTISVQTPSTTLKLEEKGYTVDRHIYGQRLLKDCITLGVEVISDAPVRDVFIEDGFVNGVGYVNRKTGEKEEIFANIVVDCSGTIGAVRQKLPDNFSEGLHQRIPDHHIAASYREISTMAVEHEYQNDLVLGYHPEIPPPGYLWYFTKGEKKLNIGTGWLKSENLNYDKSMKDIFRDALDQKYLENEDYEINVKGGGQIPIRPPFDSMVFNGGLVIGDAACLVDPVTAEGHGIALICGMIAAETIDKAIKNNDFSVQSLWEYNTRVMQRYGKRNAISYVTLQFLRIFGANGMDKILRKKLLTADELQSVFRGNTPKPTTTELLLKLVRGFPDFKLLGTLMSMTKQIGSIGYIYSNYPEGPELLNEWRQDRDRRLGEEL